MALLILAVLTLRALPAAAHGGLQPLEQWGGFPPSAAYCQRIIGTAAASCALQAASLRQRCSDRSLRGETCDESATAASIAAVRRDTLDLVDLHCSERDAQTVGYLGSFDLQADIIKFCREWESVSNSAAFGTVLPPTSSPMPDVYRCVTVTAEAIAKLAQLTFANWRATMDRIATRSWDLTAKMSMIDNTDSRAASFATRIANLLPAECSPASFESIYHRSASELAQLVGARATCFASAFYLQDEVPCPAAACGNRIIEPGEECDDGNTAAGDGCAGDCVEEVE